MARRNLWAFYGPKSGHFLPLILHKNAPRCYVDKLKTKNGTNKVHFLGIFCPFYDHLHGAGASRVVCVGVWRCFVVLLLVLMFSVYVYVLLCMFMCCFVCLCVALLCCFVVLYASVWRFCLC